MSERLTPVAPAITTRTTGAPAMNPSKAAAKVRSAVTFDELPDELKPFVKATGSASHPLRFDEELYAKAKASALEGIKGYDPKSDATVQGLVSEFFSGLKLLAPPPAPRADGVDLHGPAMQEEAAAAAKKTLSEGLLDFIKGGGTAEQARAFGAELKAIVSGAVCHVFMLEEAIDDALDDGLDVLRARFKSGASRRAEYEAMQDDEQWQRAIAAAERAGLKGTAAFQKAQRDNLELYARVSAARPSAVSGLASEPNVPTDWAAALKEQEKLGGTPMEAFERARHLYPGLYKEAIAESMHSKGPQPSTNRIHKENIP
jgi:hypothetical protein